MKMALVLHGRPDKDEYFDPYMPKPAQAHWLPWIREQCLAKGIAAPAIEMPEPYEPNYAKWCSVFDTFEPHINEDTLLVGHSAGVGFLVRWLGERRPNVGKVALVAPYLDPRHEDYGSGMYDYDVHQSLIADTKGMCVFYSTDDDEEIIESVDILKERLPGLESREFPDKGHFTLQDMKTTELPELADWLLS